MHRLRSGFSSVLQDLRYGARLLRRAPIFTGVGVSSLAIGLGAGIGLFTFMNSLLFRPLPGRDTGNIHAIFTSTSSGRWYGTSSLADFQSFTEAASEFFAGSCATTNVTANIGAGATPEAVPGALMNGGCFETLRIRAHLGRLLRASDDAPTGQPAPIVISHALWTRALDGAADVVGRSGLLNGVSVVIVGVAEPGFAGLSLDSPADFWAPPQLAPVLLSARALTDRGYRGFRVYVRLRDGVSAAQASARLSALAGQLRVDHPEAWTDTSKAARRITIVPELESRFASAPGVTTGIMSGTFGAIAVIVLIACVNLATMTVARGAGRTHELNVRIALGASRRRVLRQLATESLLISIGGVAAGVVVIAAGLRIFHAFRPAEVPAFNLALDWRVAAFAAVVAAVTPLLFGVVPGIHIVKLAIAQGLKGRPAVFRRRSLRAGPRELLLFVQVAVSFALLVMSALFMRSLATTSLQLTGTPGVVAVVPVDLQSAAATGADRRAVIERLLEASARVPDVDAPTAAALVPMTGSFLGVAARLDAAPDATSLSLDANIVAPGYFDLAGIATRAGRTFEPGDHDRAPRVAVVSESLGRRLWNTPGVVGRTLWLDEGAAEVVGVVADAPYRSVSDPEQPVLYLSMAQLPPTRLIVHARVRAGSQAIPELDRALRAVHPKAFIGAAMPLGDFRDRSLIEARFAQATAVAAGLVQLGLALMATWGLVAYAVERRTAEIAIRRALGATGARIRQLVMGGSLRLLAAGAVVGCAAGGIGASVMHATFTELAPIDFTLIVPSAAVLVGIVAVAAWLPARRASAIAPASALRQS